MPVTPNLKSRSPTCSISRSSASSMWPVIVGLAFLRGCSALARLGQKRGGQRRHCAHAARQNHRVGWGPLEGSPFAGGSASGVVAAVRVCRKHAPPGRQRARCGSPATVVGWLGRAASQTLPAPHRPGDGRAADRARSA
jgi:hypothetical protein